MVIRIPDMLKLSCLIPAVLLSAWAAGCGDTGEKKSAVERVKNQKDEQDESKAPTREDFEKRLKEMNIPIYRGAEYEKIKKNEYGRAFSIFYVLPDASQRSVEAVHTYYEKVMNGLVKEKKWKRIDAGNLIMLQEGNRIMVSVSNNLNVETNQHYLQIQMRF